MSRIFIVLCVVAVLSIPSLGSAQYFGSTFSSLENIFGPLLPPGGLSNSFRSEVGMGVAVTGFDRMQLKRGDDKISFGINSYETIDLKAISRFDDAPLQIDVYTKLRLWRFAYNLSYRHLVDRSKNVGLATLDLSVLRTGFDFDVICHNWLTAGATVDFALNDPVLSGSIYHGTNQNPISIQYSGQKPHTIGAYIRYMPPEILNYPVFFEAFYKGPLSGSRLINWGASLHFRPQIYRFDAGVKISFERNELTTYGYPTIPERPANANFNGEWRMNLEWNTYGIDAALYF